jgi:hypothetical protein
MLSDCTTVLQNFSGILAKKKIFSLKFEENMDLYWLSLHYIGEY